MCIFPGTLEIIVGTGHNWEAASFHTLGASVQDSKAHIESRGASLGSSTFRNSLAKQLWMWERNVES